MAEIIEILHNIEYKVQDQELQKAVSTVQKNVSSIENLTKRQIKLANAYDKTMAGDESRRTRLTGLIAKNTSEINKNTKSLENTMLNNKALNRVMEQEIGIIGTVENKLKILQQARKKATSPQDLSNYDNLIKQQKAKLSSPSIKAPSPGNGLLSKIGGGAVGQIASLLPAVGGALAIGGLASQIGDITKKFEGYQTVLRNTFQSSTKANEEFQKIKDFASKTPYSVDELTGSFVKLVNRGFNPTKEELTNIGDLAASQGKSFDQLTEAILDGQSGEFERLKEFGIKAKTSGDTVTLSFKGIEKQVKKTDEGALRNAIVSFGKMQGVAGGMAAASQTLDGKISNLGDSFDALFSNIGNNGKGVFGDLIDGVKTVVDLFGEMISTSPADSLREQQGELNGLVSSLIVANDNEGVRSQLMSEIASKYPEFLDLIDTERSNTEQLASALSVLNLQYENKIKLALIDERQGKITERQTDLFKRQRQAIEKLVPLLAKYGFTDVSFSELSSEKQKEVGASILKQEADKKFKEQNTQLQTSTREFAGIRAGQQGQDLAEAKDNFEQFSVINNQLQAERLHQTDLANAQRKSNINNLKEKLKQEEAELKALKEKGAENDLIIAQEKLIQGIKNQINPPAPPKSKVNDTAKKGKQKTAEELALERIDEAQKIEEERTKQAFQDRLKLLNQQLKDELITREVYDHDIQVAKENNEIILNNIGIKYDTQRIEYQKGAEKESTKTKIKELENSTSDLLIAIKERSQKLLDGLLEEARKLDDEFNNLLASAQDKEVRAVKEKYKNLQDNLQLNDIRSKRINAQTDLDNAKTPEGKEQAQKTLDALDDLFNKRTALSRQYKVEETSQAFEIDLKYFDIREAEATKRANDIIDTYTKAEQKRFDSLFAQTQIDQDGGEVNKNQVKNENELNALRDKNAEIIDLEKLSNRKRLKLEEEREENKLKIQKRAELARLYNLKKQYDNELKEIKKQQDKIDSGEIKVNAETQKNLTDKLNDILVKTADNNDKIEESEEGLRKRRGQGLSQETKDAFAYVDSVLSGAATIAAALEENADREIEIRERRVDKAMEIASRGNAEALQIEEERLRKAQKQKEKAARAQMAINLAQQLSAATLAIAEAAASGAGWASVALVAAVIAALASGYSAVSSMNQEPVGYATGVVGLNGQGTGTSDSIPAMLSKGESVITAKGTGLEDNAEILKMMNNGVGFKMPKLKDSTNFTTNNTQSMSTKNLEQKLDRVISAVENIKESSVVIDENGMVAMSRAVEVKMRRRDKL